VQILSPAPGEPIFGEVEVRLAVQAGGSPVQRVEVYLDGVRVGVLTRPPWNLAVDVGDANVEHHLEAVAVDRSGASTQTSLLSGTIAVHDQIEVALRPLFVRVERDGAPVPDLQRGSFTVFDDGVRQEIVTFERGDVPFTAVLLLDASASMVGGRLGSAVSGVEAFARALQPMDEAKLLLFADRVLLESPFANAASFLTLGLADAQAGGGTALNDALFLALARLEGRPGRKVVLILSDGEDVDSVLSMAAVQTYARRSGVILYWLRLGMVDDSRQSYTPWRGVAAHEREKRLFRETVNDSGGRMLPVPVLDGVRDALAAVLQELREQYVIGYYPSATRGSDTWHEVRVEVAAPGTSVRSHRGYLEP
jgi:Ca-activated chloride channel homolog